MRRGLLAPVLAAFVLATACGRAAERSGPTPQPPPQLAMAAPQVGSPAPGGVLERSDGAPLDLAASFAGHTTVLVFYRGFW